MNQDALMTLGRVEGKVDTILANQIEHSHRIASLEKARWYVGGVFAAVMIYVGKLHFLPS